MNHKMALFLILLSAFLCSCSRNTTENRPPKITITGVITNRSALKGNKDRDAYLQLLTEKKAGDTVEVKSYWDDKGHLCRFYEFGPALATIPVSSRGRFSLVMENLKTGKYQILAQNLYWGNENSLNKSAVPFLSQNGKVLLIEIPELAGKPLKIDVGKVQIPIPPSGTN
jgi:hypothetical protein